MKGLRISPFRSFALYSKLSRTCHSERIKFTYPPFCSISCFRLGRNLRIPPCRSLPSCLRWSLAATFHKPLLRPTSHHQRRLPCTGKDGSHTSLCLGYIVDWMCPPTRASVASDEASTKCVISRFHCGTLHPSCCSILDTSGQFRFEIGPATYSSRYNSVPEYMKAAHISRFPPNPTRHTAKRFWPLTAAWPMFGTIHRPSRNTIFASFDRSWSILDSQSLSASKMGRVRSVSAAYCVHWFSPGCFSASNHAAPKRQACFASRFLQVL